MQNRKLKLFATLGLGLGGLLFFLAVLFVGFQLGSSAGYFDAQARGYSAQYPSDTEKRISRCFEEIDRKAHAECVGHVMETARSEVIAEQDLGAQREMAHWAKWLLIVTLGQIPLNIAGLILLLRTISQGQEALSHAREVAYEELRAYLFLGFPVMKLEGSMLTIYTPIRNSGQTPARNVKIEMGSFVQPYPLPEPLPNYEPNAVGFSTIGPHVERGMTSYLPVNPAVLAAVTIFQLAILLRIRYSYETYSGAIEEHEVNMWAAGQDFIDKKMNHVMPLDLRSAATRRAPVSGRRKGSDPPV